MMNDRADSAIRRGLALGLICLVLGVVGPVQAQDTIVVTAEGLADPNAETYARDKGLLVDDLRRDARRQAVEKAVGVFVEGSTLVENYVTIEDRVLSETQGLIKRVIKESKPWVGEDGFAHMLIKAEVYLKGVEDALKTMSRQTRVSYIREYGNPENRDDGIFDAIQSDPNHGVCLPPQGRRFFHPWSRPIRCQERDLEFLGDRAKETLDHVLDGEVCQQ
jgi:hypothetical protein